MQPIKDPGKDFEGMTWSSLARSAMTTLTPPPKKMPRPQPDEEDAKTTTYLPRVQEIATPDMQCGFEADTQGDDDVDTLREAVEKQRKAVDILRNYFHPATPHGPDAAEVETQAKGSPTKVRTVCDAIAAGMKKAKGVISDDDGFNINIDNIDLNVSDPVPSMTSTEIQSLNLLELNKIALGEQGFFWSTIVRCTTFCPDAPHLPLAPVKSMHMEEACPICQVQVVRSSGEVGGCWRCQLIEDNDLPAFGTPGRTPGNSPGRGEWYDEDSLSEDDPTNIYLQNGIGHQTSTEED